jgi:UTP--glucose-1-phosphate uridylyltransferase
VGDEPFAVVLADDLIDPRPPPPQLDVYGFFGARPGRHGGALGRSSYGCIDAEPVRTTGRDRVYRIRDLVEKPKATRRLQSAIIGRYVLLPEIFDSLQAINPGSGGEIQLTDALRHLLRARPIYAYRFEGTRYDAGDKLGFLKATVEFALKRKDLGGPFREYLRGLRL